METRALKNQAAQRPIRMVRKAKRASVWREPSDSSRRNDRAKWMDTGICSKVELAGGFCDSVPPATQPLPAPNNRVAAVACLDLGLDVHRSAPWFLSRV